MRSLLLAADTFDIGWWDRVAFLFQHQHEPLIVSMLMGATLGLVGCFVVLRRMALLGDAISHAVLPGVVIAFLIIGSFTRTVSGSAEMGGLFLGALLAGLLTTGGVNLITRHSRVKEDSAIGIAFTAMFAVGVILISSLPRGAHFDLQCFLFGEVLAIRREDVITALIIAPSVLLLVLLFYQPLKLMSFDPQMAAASGLPTQFLHYLLMGVLSAVIVAALQSVGVIMSVAMLITPAAIAYQLTNRFWIMLTLSALAGMISSILGMILAFGWNWPPGPTMVVVATVLFLGTMAFAPEYGQVARFIRRRRVRAHILREDVLKELAKAESADVPTLSARVGLASTDQEIEATLRALTAAQLVEREGTIARLTPAGHQHAERLVRSHRLWETYLAEHNVPHERIHEVAEELEHAYDVAEEVAHELGHPEVDPHGERIPAPPQ